MVSYPHPYHPPAIALITFSLNRVGYADLASAVSNAGGLGIVRPLLPSLPALPPPHPLEIPS